MSINAERRTKPPMDDKPKAYQVAIDLGYDIGSNLEEYKRFLYELDTENPHVMSMPKVVGEYDKLTHVFYGVGPKEGAEKFIEKAKEKGLGKHFHMDEF